MQTFFKVNDTTFVSVEQNISSDLTNTETNITYFTNKFIINDKFKVIPADFNKDGLTEEGYILANFPSSSEALAVWEAVKDRTFLETISGLDFYLDKKTFKITACIGNQEINLDTPDSKNILVSERKRMKNFLKDIKKSKETYKMGDRILLYGPTGTGKTYNFIEFLKASNVEHAIIPVSEGMEDLDLLNFIVPSSTGVSYKPKDITLLLEKAEAGQKVCIVFDELNRGSNSLMNLVLKAIDPVDGVNYYITNVLQDRTYVIPQENIIWGATVNLGGKYTGVNSLDEALFDRFNIINFVGYNPAVEESIIESAGFAKEHRKKIVSFIDAIREFCTSGELRSPISTRGIKVWMEEYINQGDLLQSFERTLLYRLISVDEFGFPNAQELEIVKGEFKKTLLTAPAAPISNI